MIGLASTIGILISRKFTISQRLVIASFFSGIAQVIAITVTRENLIANLDNNLSSTNNDLQKQIDELKKYIKKLDDDKNI